VRPVDLVFPTQTSEIMVDYRKLWLKVAKLDELRDGTSSHLICCVIHLHRLPAGDLGYSEGTIATLIGHKGHSITSRCVHTVDAVLLAAVDAVADKTLRLMAQSNLKSGSDQPQPRLQSDRPDIGSSMRDEIPSL
jgi:hypothetical protein